MQLYDFITPEEIEDLGDLDDQSAFLKFVRIAQDRLGEAERRFQHNEEWEAMKEARQSFMNIVVAAAKRYNIEPFLSLEVPRVEDFNYEEHRQFKADLDHFVVQIVLERSARSRRDSVTISPELKAKIHKYLYALRKLIVEADDLDDTKRESLLRKLGEFEAELEKKRLHLMAVTLFVLALLSAPGGFLSTYDAANRLLTNILRTVGDAKAAEDATRLISPPDTPLAISGPRKPEVIQGARADQLDDEIPF